jgi:hypothetical protein
VTFFLEGAENIKIMDVLLGFFLGVTQFDVYGCGQILVDLVWCNKCVSRPKSTEELITALQEKWVKFIHNFKKISF